MATWGYARVSTKIKLNGDSLEKQYNQLKRAGCHVIVQEQCTGGSTERPKLQELLGKLKTGDTLVITKLDRLAKTVRNGTMLIRNLVNKGITVDILNLGVIDNKPINNLMMGVLLVFAECERNMIIERTQAGKEIARNKHGFKEGRPVKYNDYKINNALRLLQEGESYKEVEKKSGISKSTLIRAKRKLNSTVAF